MNVCDFCNVPETNGGTTWTIEASDFATALGGGPVEQMSHGSWAACAPCAGLVKARNMRGLVKRVLASLSAAGLPRDAMPAAERDLIETYRRLFAHMTTVHPTTPADTFDGAMAQARDLCMSEGCERSSAVEVRHAAFKADHPLAWVRACWPCARAWLGLPPETDPREAHMTGRSRPLTPRGEYFAMIRGENTWTHS